MMTRKLFLGMLVMVMLLPISFLINLPLRIDSEFDPDKDILGGHKIDVFVPETMSISDFEWSHVIHSFQYTYAEEEVCDKREIHVYLDGEEIKLKDKKLKEGKQEEQVITKWFYQEFSPEFFVQGVFNWTVTLEEKTGEIVWSEYFPLTVLDNGHKIDVSDPETMDVWALERSYVYYSLSLTEEQYELRKPLKYHVLLDGVELKLYEIVEEQVIIDQPSIYHLHFYQTFDAYYFSPGMYKWQVIIEDNSGIVWEDDFILSILDDDHRIVVYQSETMTINERERTFVQHGVWLTEELFYQLPLYVELFIDGEQVLFNYQKTDIDHNRDAPYGWYFYKTFDAFHFTPGEYTWEIVWYLNNEEELRMSETLIVTEEGYKINVFDPTNGMTMFENNVSYISSGWRAPESYWESLEYDRYPLEVKLFIDQQEIELQLACFLQDYQGELNYYWIYYKTFEKYYFEPGVYDWTVVFYENYVEVYRLNDYLIVLKEGRINIIMRSMTRIAMVPVIAGIIRAPFVCLAVTIDFSI